MFTTIVPNRSAYSFSSSSSEAKASTAYKSWSTSAGANAIGGELSSREEARVAVGKYPIFLCNVLSAMHTRGRSSAALRTDREDDNE